MDAPALNAIALTAAGIGFMHTLAGPDHYLPFVAMSKVGGWSLTRTIVITMLCGLGHVLGSVALGGAGIAVGAGLGKLEWFESFRGDVAGWLLLGFGLAYMAWGIRRGLRSRPHSHLHAHANGTVHAHAHTHHAEHVHIHAHADGQTRDDVEPAVRMTPWILFTIFVFGPCEPLIPLIMYPAARHSVAGVVWVSTIFGVVTITTMTTIVVAAHLGLANLNLPRLARYSHAAAGFALAACGAAVTLGL